MQYREIRFVLVKVWERGQRKCSCMDSLVAAELSIHPLLDHVQDRLGDAGQIGRGTKNF